MIKFRLKPTRHKRQRQRQAMTESLETRALLSAFYVNGDNLQGPQDGSEASPFGTIRQGIEAALQNPGDDEVIILPQSSGPYTTPTAITPGYSDNQIPGFSTFNGDLTVRGGGASSADVVIDTSYGDAFYIDAPIAVTVQNLTIRQSGRHGILNRSTRPVVVDNVQITDHSNTTGIIHQGADLTVRNSVLEGNHQGIWGGIGTYAGTNTPTAAPGHLTVVDTVSRGNRYHGAFLNQATGDVQFTNFTAETNGFAGIRVMNSERLRVEGGVFANNGRNGLAATLVQDVAINGVLVEQNGTVDTFYNPGGGGIHVQPGSANEILITDSIIRDNENWGNGGGIEIWAPQDTFIATATIRNTMVENNRVREDGAGGRGWGGGIAINGNSHLDLSGSTIRGNSAYQGGGIDFRASTSVNGQFGDLSVDHSSIIGNSSVVSAGGIFQLTGAIQLHNSTIAENEGAIGGVRMTVMGGEISNTTISSNRGEPDGGLLLTSRNPLLVVNSTITGNSGFYNGGLRSFTSSVQLLNTIVAGNLRTSGEGFPEPGEPSDLRGNITSLGHNLFGEADNAVISSDRVTHAGPHSTDLFGTASTPLDARLGPLQDNGGPTFTHLPLPDSPALDAGDDQHAAVPPSDQRGISRPQRSGIEIGAVEIANQKPAVSVNSPAVSIAEGGTAEHSGTFSDPDGDTVTLSASSGVVIQHADGSWTWTQATDDGPADGTVVTITAEDQFGAVEQTSFTLIVMNAGPTAAVTGPSSALTGEVIEFHLSATDASQADQQAGFDWQIDWDSDGTIDQTVSGASPVIVSHTFTTAGSQTVTITAEDKDGGTSAPVTHDILVVQRVQLEADASLNLNSADKGNKTFEIIVHSTTTFDATSVDVSSVLWAGAGVARSRLKDVDRDGDLDLVLQFHIRQTDLIERYRNAMAEDRSENHKLLNINLTGRTTAGTPVLGTTALDLFMTGKSLRELLDSL